MRGAFEEAKSRDYPSAETPIETAALRFTHSWSSWPPLHLLLHYRGVNLGETNEYHLFPKALADLLNPPMEDPDA